MIIELRAKNCFSFYEQINFSMKADMRSSKFKSNVHTENYFNILKTAGIYGPNNVGKTCLVKCIKAVKAILSNGKNEIMPNLFHQNPICELGITFLWRGREFSYDFHYDVKKEEYPYEKFSEIIKDQYGNTREEIWVLKDSRKEIYDFKDKKLRNIIQVVAKTNLLIYTIDSKKFKYLAMMKDIVRDFANTIDIVYMNDIPMERTINLLKNKNNLQKKVVEFIKNADLYMDDYEYMEINKLPLKDSLKNFNSKPDEKVLDITDQIMDQICLVSVYKGVAVPSMLFDSTGTKKIAALASYIIEALENGRILIVDELDSSIHFKLTRAIVAMFNNELNQNAQLIFTVHDINLMDCKRMFRKEQIWFIHKDTEGVYVYSLAEFTAQKGIRDTTDIMEKYRKGVLGALPDPNLIKTLLSINGNKKGDSFDE